MRSGINLNDDNDTSPDLPSGMLQNSGTSVRTFSFNIMLLFCDHTSQLSYFEDLYKLNFIF